MVIGPADYFWQSPIRDSHPGDSWVTTMPVLGWLSKPVLLFDLRTNHGDARICMYNHIKCKTATACSKNYQQAVMC